MERQPLKPYSSALLKELRELAESELYQKRAPRADLVGKRVGRLVIQRAVGQGSHRRVRVLVHCDCGNAKIMLYDGLKAGTKSCGCLDEERRPALKKQRIFGELLNRTIHNSRTAKPVETETRVADVDSIDVPMSQAVIATENLAASATGGNDGTG